MSRDIVRKEDLKNIFCHLSPKSKQDAWQKFKSASTPQHFQDIFNQYYPEAQASCALLLQTLEQSEEVLCNRVVPLIEPLKGLFEISENRLELLFEFGQKFSLKHLRGLSVTGKAFHPYRKSNLQLWNFENCVFHCEVNVSQCNLTGTTFWGSQFHGAFVARQTNLTGVNLSCIADSPEFQTDTETICTKLNLEKALFRRHTHYFSAVGENDAYGISAAPYAKELCLVSKHPDPEIRTDIFSTIDAGVLWERFVKEYPKWKSYFSNQSSVHDDKDVFERCFTQLKLARENSTNSSCKTLREIVNPDLLALVMFDWVKPETPLPVSRKSSGLEPVSARVTPTQHFTERRASVVGRVNSDEHLNDHEIALKTIERTEALMRKALEAEILMDFQSAPLPPEAIALGLILLNEVAIVTKARIAEDVMQTHTARLFLQRSLLSLENLQENNAKALQAYQLLHQQKKGIKWVDGLLLQNIYPEVLFKIVYEGPKFLSKDFYEVLREFFATSALPAEIKAIVDNIQMNVPANYAAWAWLSLDVVKNVDATVADDVFTLACENYAKINAWSQGVDGICLKKLCYIAALLEKQCYQKVLTEVRAFRFAWPTLVIDDNLRKILSNALAHICETTIANIEDAFVRCLSTEEIKKIVYEDAAIDAIRDAFSALLRKNTTAPTTTKLMLLVNDFEANMKKLHVSIEITACLNVLSEKIMDNQQINRDDIATLYRHIDQEFLWLAGDARRQALLKKEVPQLNEPQRWMLKVLNRLGLYEKRVEKNSISDVNKISSQEFVVFLDAVFGVTALISQMEAVIEKIWKDYSGFKEDVIRKIENVWRFPDFLEVDKVSTAQAKAWVNKPANHLPKLLAAKKIYLSFKISEAALRTCAYPDGDGAGFFAKQKWISIGAVSQKTLAVHQEIKNQFERLPIREQSKTFATRLSVAQAEILEIYERWLENVSSMLCVTHVQRDENPVYAPS